MLTHPTVTRLPRGEFLLSHHVLETLSEQFRWTCITSEVRQTHSDRDTPVAVETYHNNHNE